MHDAFALHYAFTLLLLAEHALAAHALLFVRVRLHQVLGFAHALLAQRGHTHGLLLGRSLLHTLRRAWRRAALRRALLIRTIARGWEVRVMHARRRLRRHAAVEVLLLLLLLLVLALLLLDVRHELRFATAAVEDLTFALVLEAALLFLHHVLDSAAFESAAFFVHGAFFLRAAVAADHLLFACGPVLVGLDAALAVFHVHAMPVLFLLLLLLMCDKSLLFAERVLAADCALVHAAKAATE